jgi:fibronectin type 3 domain-containing protein
LPRRDRRRASLPLLAVLCIFAALLSGCANGNVTTTVNQGPAYEVDLTWSQPSAGSNQIVGYYVFRAAANSAYFQQLNASLDDKTVYIDSNVQSGTTYYYMVVAVDTSGNWSMPSVLTTASVP